MRTLVKELRCTKNRVNILCLQCNSIDLNLESKTKKNESSFR